MYWAHRELQRHVIIPLAVKGVCGRLKGFVVKRHQLNSSSLLSIRAPACCSKPLDTTEFFYIGHCEAL